MSTDPERWMNTMRTEMDTLKSKHTWDLVKSPPGANIMDSMWVYDIKWDGEGNRIKDKARLVGKRYTQQLGVDYHETWEAVTRLESICMTAAMATKLNLKLWRLDFVGAYLNSLTKEDIYMKQPEGFIGLDTKTTSVNSFTQSMVRCREDMTGMRHSAKHMMNSATLHLGWIPVFNSRKKEVTIPSQIPTLTILLALPIMMRRLKRERMKLEWYGK